MKTSTNSMQRTGGSQDRQEEDSSSSIDNPNSLGMVTTGITEDVLFLSNIGDDDDGCTEEDIQDSSL